MTLLPRLCAGLLFLSLADPVFALAEERIGPNSTRPFPESEQPYWPRGLIDLLNRESRVYSIWVNGNNTFHFDAGPPEIAAILEAFSKIRMRDHVVTIKPGTPVARTFQGMDILYTVDLRYLEGIALAMTRRGGAAETYDPTLTIHVDPQSDASWVDRLELPANLIVRNELEGSTLKGHRTQPERRTWHSRILFMDDEPAVDFENGVSTTVTLWEDDGKPGLRLGQVDYEGYFHTPFSERELQELRDGTAWMTLTVGNFLTVPSPTHPRLRVGNLGLERDGLVAVKLGRPSYYHGRILFEDGSPPILDPEPWPGGAIGVDFSYAGKVTPDKEGYFRVFFTADQFAELQEKKERHNIYVPSYEERGHCRALHTFPVGKLSRDRESAGVVRIPRPQPPAPPGD